MDLQSHLVEKFIGKGKSLTLVYCGEDASAGKALAEKIRDGSNRIITMSGLMDVGAPMPAARVIVMPDVPAWRRNQIEKAYPGIVQAPEPPVAKIVHSATRTTRHKGFGRWYVMDGDTQISGPHTKDEAERLCA